MEQNVIYLPLILAVVGLVYMFIRASWVRKQAPGSERMQEISKAIKEGALAFLNAEYRLLFIFVIIASVALFGISIAVETTSLLLLLCQNSHRLSESNLFYLKRYPMTNLPD